MRINKTSVYDYIILYTYILYDDNLHIYILGIW